MNHYHKQLSKVAFSKTSFILLLHLSLDAGVLPFFNPIEDKEHINFSLQSLVANNAISLEAIFDDKKESSLNHKNGNYNAINSSRLDIGVNYDSFGYIGYTYRNNVFIDMSNDSMNFLYTVKYKKDLDENRRYSLDANAEEFETQGITYSNHITPFKSQTSSLKIGFAISAVVASNAQGTNLTGYATSLGESDYDFEANVEYVYNENVLYDYEVDAYKGYGYNLNLALIWESESYSLKFLANDLYSRIYWEKLAYSTIIASSDNKEYDDNGYPIYKPAIKGKEGYSNYVQKLAPRYEVEISYEITKKDTIDLGSDYYQDLFFPYINIKHDFSKNFHINSGYETFFGMFNLGIGYRSFKIEIKSDSFTEPLSSSITLLGAYSF